MRILQVSTSDVGGGAEGVALKLLAEYGRLGHDSWLAVGARRGDDARVLAIPRRLRHRPWSYPCQVAAFELRRRCGRVPGVGQVCRLLEAVAYPAGWRYSCLGHEDFSAPGTWRLLRLPPRPPDVVHCHNLHGPAADGGQYFDLTALPWLSGQVPVVMTLHDAWLLSGHCAHSFDCDRWKTGCGRCPDLTIWPALPRDGTAYNWRRKRDICTNSRLFVATPSRWLMRQVEQSVLAAGAVETRVIPNGIDLAVFHPADRLGAREALGLPAGARVLLFTANSIRNNMWKDYTTMRAAVGRAAENLRGSQVLFLAMGEAGPPEQIGPAQVRFVPYQHDPAQVARYYQAADVYLHAARADTFPTTVLEALACGTPVIATAVGGIPEQVRGEEDGAKATGILVPPADAAAMASAIERLLTDDGARLRMGTCAAEDARGRFDLKRQAQTYLQWYKDIVERRRAGTAQSS